jgi:hypothetical protein
VRDSIGDLRNSGRRDGPPLNPSRERVYSAGKIPAARGNGVCSLRPSTRAGVEQVPNAFAESAAALYQILRLSAEGSGFSTDLVAGLL